MAEATGRWKISSVNGYRQPRRYVPGDVVALPGAWWPWA